MCTPPHTHSHSYSYLLLLVRYHLKQGIVAKPLVTIPGYCKISQMKKI